MKLIDIFKKYGTGKDNSVMIKATEALSSYIEEKLTEDEYCTLKKKVYETLEGGHFNKEFADIQIAKLYYKDDSGEIHRGPYWTDDEIYSVYQQYKPKLGEYNLYDFAVTLNMIKSDNCNKLKKWFPNATKEEMLAKLIEETLNWLDDDDNPFGKEKIWRYFNS